MISTDNYVCSRIRNRCWWSTTVNGPEGRVSSHVHRIRIHAVRSRKGRRTRHRHGSCFCERKTEQKREIRKRKKIPCTQLVPTRCVLFLPAIRRRHVFVDASFSNDTGRRAETRENGSRRKREKVFSPETGPRKRCILSRRVSAPVEKSSRDPGLNKKKAGYRGYRVRESRPVSREQT